MSHTDMGIVGPTTDTFILFENGVGRNLSLSETLSGWRLRAQAGTKERPPGTNEGTVRSEELSMT
ncbi:hypothetical protein [Bradyrhizobium sp. AZCC 2289]|uniref:hypothetical protein n=1 Tax=Bradyrhizobium sp. AZCC 2289 TaxID=3117026 RepID=UPI002FF33EF4